ncbi:hypothetical protein M514_08992, partial [Trichuris suis]
MTLSEDIYKRSKGTEWQKMRMNSWPLRSMQNDEQRKNIRFTCDQSNGQVFAGKKTLKWITGSGRKQAKLLSGRCCSFVIAQKNELLLLQRCILLSGHLVYPSSQARRRQPHQCKRKWPFRKVGISANRPLPLMEKQ